MNRETQSVKVDEAYQVISRDYDAHRDRSPYFRIIEGLTHRCFYENTEGKSFARGLDAGCGTGRNLPHYLKKCDHVAGFDYTPEMLQFAKEKFQNEKRVRLMLGDVCHLPFPDQTFDLIGSFKVLPHVPKVLEGIREIERVARPGAIIFLEFYSPYSFRYLLNRMKHYTKWHSLRESKRLIARAGLKVRKVYGLRTFMATEYLTYLPGAYQLFNFLENRFTHSGLNRFSGYYVIVCEKQGS